MSREHPTVRWLTAALVAPASAVELCVAAALLARGPTAQDWAAMAGLALAFASGLASLFEDPCDDEPGAAEDASVCGAELA